MITSGRFALACLLLGLSPNAPRAEGTAPPAPIDRRHAEGSFIDDPFALSPDGTRLAYITTNGATHAELHITPIADKGGGVTLPYPSITPERIEFLDGERVLVVERNPESRVARAQVFDRKGPARERFGPADDIALATIEGVPAVVTYQKTRGANGKTRHELAAYRRDNLRPIASKVFSENNDGRVSLATGLYKPLFFEEGFAWMIAQKEGAYDKAHDIRKPDLAARLESFSEKLLEQREIQDVIAWAELSLLRRKHQNESYFVRFTDDLRHLQLIDAEDRTSELSLPRPIGKYDPQTLVYEPAPRGGLMVSLTIDPVNPDAVRAKKADKDWLDVYHLDFASHQLHEVVRLDGEKRPTAWHIAGTRLALLRKHKGFGRGGADLEVYELAPKPPAVDGSHPVPRTDAGAAPKAPSAAPGGTATIPPSGKSSPDAPTSGAMTSGTKKAAAPSTPSRVPRGTGSDEPGPHP